MKLEGPKYDVIRYLVGNGVAVVGHTGLTPQTAANFKQVGREAGDAERILAETVGIVEVDAFLVVLEHMLAINDTIGLGEKWPPFSRRYAYVGDVITGAATEVARQVKEKRF